MSRFGAILLIVVLVILGVLFVYPGTQTGGKPFWEANSTPATTDGKTQEVAQLPLSVEPKSYSVKVSDVLRVDTAHGLLGLNSQFTVEPVQIGCETPNLKPDGSFSYTPNALSTECLGRNNWQDKFSYNIVDKQGQRSGPFAVNITITGVVTPSPTPSPTPSMTPTPRPDDPVKTEEPDANSQAALLSNNGTTDQGGGANDPVDPPSGTADQSGVVLGDGHMDWKEWEAISQGYTNGSEDTGLLIDLLDRYATDVKVSEDVGGWTVSTDANHVEMIWAGMYGLPDITFNGQLEWYLVDGNGAHTEGTGFFLLEPNSSIEVPNTGAHIRLEGWNGDTRPLSGPRYFETAVQTQSLLGQGGGGTIQASACVPNASVIPLVASLGNADGTFIGLDTVANTNPNARLRSGSQAVVTVVAWKSLLWVRSGNAQGPVLAGPENDGKTLYIATENGEVTMTHSFSGVQVCDPVTSADLSWVTNGVSASISPTPVPSPTAETQIATTLGQGGGQSVTGCVPVAEIQSAFNNTDGSRNDNTTVANIMSGVVTRFPAAVSKDKSTLVTYGNTTTLVWAGNGNLPNPPFLKLNDTGNGVWFLTIGDGSYFVDQDWTSLKLCGDLNPARDFSKWWGK